MKNTVAIPAVIITADGMCLSGLGVSSARLAAVSKPTKSSTPYSTPKKIPAQPSAEEEGLNGLALFAEPSFTMTTMKNTVTTMIETSASTSGLRVHLELRRDGGLQVAADEQQQPGQQHGDAGVVQPARGRADPLAEAAGHVVVQRARGVDLLGVAGHDPANREHADRGDQHRQRRGDAPALARRADHPDHQRDHEGRGEDRAHEPDGLRDD